VFPGGRVDAADSGPALHERIRGLPSSPAPDSAYWVAALRELFEETGVLVARSPDQEWMPEAGSSRRVDGCRRALMEGSATFLDVLDTLDATLDAEGMVHAAHWITPVAEPRRYDTHFFAAALPPGRDASPDPREMTESAWLTPVAALARFEALQADVEIPAAGQVPDVCHADRSLADLDGYVEEALRTWEVPGLALAVALFLIGTIGYNEIAFGLGGIPASLFLVFLSARFGGLAVRLGPRVFMTVGQIIMGASLLWLARHPVDSPPWVIQLDRPETFLPSVGYLVDVLPALVVFGIGISILVAPLVAALMRSVPVRNSGVASAFNNAISRVGPQFVGAALFVAISASFWAMLAGSAGIDPSDPQLRADVAPLNPPPSTVGPAVADTVRQASTGAFHLAMLAGAGLCFAGAAINWLGIRDEDLRGEQA
jgi:8-oxo-dGTP pyrophosphatase MutT (NUDIX family)